MSFPSTGDFPREGDYPDVNPLNLGAVAYDIVGEQAHADGEIWSARNFDIRDLFLDRYPATSNKSGIACADGVTPVEQCEGNRRWVQLMFDAYLLMPIGPTFLDARDAYLAADLIRFGGANQDILWRGFARRGFGEDATTANNGDDQPVPSWESPLESEATLTFVAEDEAGTPVDADVFVGHYEARATPIDDVETFVANPEGYEFVAKAAGHGFVRFHVRKLAADESRTITIRFAENWASSANGAVAAGNGENHGNLIAETESTNWQDTSAPVQGRQVTVQLAGPRRFRLAKVSAYLMPGQNRFSALRAFELYACTAGADAGNPTCDPANAAGWKRILKSRADAFPAKSPRPVAPRPAPADVPGPHDDGHAREARRRLEPVHGEIGLPRPAGPGSGQRDRLPHDADRQPGPRGRAAASPPGRTWRVRPRSTSTKSVQDIRERAGRAGPLAALW
jgi:extracellular elastinolytic metalloproteinase